MIDATAAENAMNKPNQAISNCKNCGNCKKKEKEQQEKIDAANEILKNIVVYEQDIHAMSQINELKELLK